MANKHIGSSFSEFLHEEGVPPSRYLVRLKPGLDQEAIIARLEQVYGISDVKLSEWKENVFSAVVPDPEVLIGDAAVQAVSIEGSHRMA